MKKVFIINGWGAYEALFIDIGYAITNNFDEADLVCFTGGEDVNPALYNHPPHPTTCFNTYRDQREYAFFEKALAAGKPMVGICRGGQFLNVCSGGEMYQNVTDHCRDHWIKASMVQNPIKVSSTHHQMMKPSSKGRLVAFSTHPYVREYWDGEKFVTEASLVGNEVVFYDHTKCLCFQPHPEFDGYPEMRKYFKTLVNLMTGD